MGAFIPHFDRTSRYIAGVNSDRADGDSTYDDWVIVDDLNDGSEMPDETHPGCESGQKENGDKCSSPHQNIGVQSDPPVQHGQSDPPLQQAQSDPSVQQVQSDPPVQQVQSDPPVQQVQSDPPVQQVQSDPPLQHGQSDPPLQHGQSDPPVQQVQSDPPVQQVQSDPPVQQVQLNDSGDNDPVRRQITDPRRARDMAAKHALQRESYSLSNQIDPHTVSSALYARQIISSDDVERAQTKAMGTKRERAHSLIMTVIRKVNQKPSLFDEVCDVLETEGVSVRDLKCEYQCKYAKLTRNRSRGDGEPDTYSTSSYSYSPSVEIQQAQSDPPVQHRQSDPPVQQVQFNPPVQQAQFNPSVQQVQSDPSVQQVQSDPPVQQVQSDPPVQHGQSDPPVQQVQSDPPVHHGQSDPPVQQVQSDPPVQQVQSDPSVQQAQSDPPVQQVQSDPPVQHGQSDPPVQQAQLNDSGEPDTYSTSSCSYSPSVEIQQACRRGSFDTVRRLLESKQAGINGTIITEDGETLLHVALNHGHLKVFLLLLGSLTDMDVNAQDKKRRTPLHAACLVATHYTTALEESIQRQMQKDIIVNLLKYGAKTEIQDEEGQTPLHLACQKTDAKIVTILLSQDTSCLETKDENGDTALHIASDRGALDVVHILLQHKAYPHTQNKSSYTPLHLACLQQRVEVAELLVKYDPSTVDGLDQHMNTPLHLACDENNATLVSVLLGCRVCQVYKHNQEGLTPLHLASKSGNSTIVKHLLKRCHSDGFVNDQCRKGNTALHIACQLGFKHVVSILKSNNAKTDIKNHDNMTPIDVARRNQHKAIVQLLEPRGHFFTRSMSQNTISRTI